jgi:ABC-2 type transport system ATP-binding protein
LKTEVVLEINGLCKSYGNLLAVNDLSLEICRGEVFGLLGPNGAGKTTTINLISGLLKPDAGEIYFHGNLLAGGRRHIRERIGICPQENVFWKRLTPAEQLIFLGNMYNLKPAWIRQQSQDLLDSLGLTGVANQQAGTLSGGMQRRLNIALALIHDPEIIILDEPETGLDPQSRISVREYIKTMAKNKTVLLTTHNMDEAERMADRVAIIDRGVLLVLDSPENLKQTVGEGDVLEISLKGNLAQVENALSYLENRAQFLVVEDILQVRALDLVNILQDILLSLDRHEVRRGEIRLRKNTLEDVFIQLTGRRLRE